jgi:hypothetical protein
MLLDLAELLLEPDAYVCIWRNGELFIEASVEGDELAQAA